MRQMKLIRQLAGSNQGSSSVIIVCAAVAIIILSALLTDIGYAAAVRYRLNQCAVDSAKNAAGLLIKKRELAAAAARNTALKMVSDLNQLNIKVSDTGEDVSVHLEKEFNYIFLRFFGFKEKLLKASATARLSRVASFKGIRPFAVQKRNFIFGERLQLEFEPLTDSKAVRIIPLALGKDSFKPNVAYGYRKVLHIGDGLFSAVNEDKAVISEEIRNLMKGCTHQPKCTYDQYSSLCTKIVVLPVVDHIDSTGNKTMNILGFAAFFIEDVSLEQGNVRIGGRFIRHIAEAGTSDNIEDFGLAGMKIIN